MYKRGENDFYTQSSPSMLNERRKMKDAPAAAAAPAEAADADATLGIGSLDGFMFIFVLHSSPSTIETIVEEAQISLASHHYSGILLFSFLLPLCFFSFIFLFFFFLLLLPASCFFTLLHCIVECEAVLSTDDPVESIDNRILPK